MEPADVSSKVADVTRRRDWKEAALLLEHGQLSQEQRKHVTDEASQHAEEQDFITFILPVLTEGDLLSVMHTLFTRHLWTAVGKMLDRNVSMALNTKIIVKAKYLGNKEMFSKHILPNCKSGQLDICMTHLVNKSDFSSVLDLLWIARHEKLVWTVGETPVGLSLLVQVAMEHWEFVGSELKKGVTDSQCRWAVDVACKCARDDYLARFILPHCAEDQYDDIMATLVTRGLWKSVGYVLDHVVDQTQYSWVVTEACKQAGDQTISENVILHCPDHQLEDILTTLVKRELWQSVCCVLNRVVSRAQHLWAVDEALQQASDYNIAEYILRHCTRDQLDEILTSFVTRGEWMYTDSMFHHSVSPALRRQAINEACEKADELDILLYILPHCPNNQLEDALTLMVTRGLWKAVGEVLDHFISPGQRRWALREACQQAGSKEILQHILPHCPADQLEEVLPTLVTRGLWRCVGRVLERGVTQAQHRWAIREACQRSRRDNIVFENILPHCPDDLLEEVLTPLVDEGLWMSVGKVLGCHAVSPSQHVWALCQACHHADTEDITKHILPHIKMTGVTDSQLDDVLKPLVMRDLWVCVDTVLNAGVSEAQLRWAIREACERANVDISHILSHCPDDFVDDALMLLVKRDSWWFVGYMLEKGVSPSRHRWVIMEACQRADDRNIVGGILPCCNAEQFDEVLTHLVSRGLWESADFVLDHGVSPARHRWAVNEACQRADDRAIIDHVLPHCADDQLEEVLTSIVNRGLVWSAVHVLHRVVRPACHRWVISEMCYRADENDIEWDILPHCGNNHLDDVLTPLVTRGLWQCVCDVLDLGVSPEQHRWALHEACQRIDDQRIINRILSSSPSEWLDDIVTILVKQKLWESVSRVLSHGVSPAKHRWTVHEVCQEAEQEGSITLILNHCHDDLLDDVLTTLVTRCLWGSVVGVLGRGVSPAQHRWAIQEACLHADDWQFRQYMLRHCTDDQLEDVLAMLLARGRWETVGCLLYRLVSPSTHRWVINEACQLADDRNINAHILPHCDDDQLDDVLTTLVTRGLWGSVDSVIALNVSPVKRERAIYEACHRADDCYTISCILQHCAERQLDDVLTVLVKRGLWNLVGFAIHLGVSPAQRKWAVCEASQQADDFHFSTYILTHCDDDQVDDVLTPLVTRGMWTSVCELLQIGVSPAQHRWVMSEVVKTADDSLMMMCMLPDDDYHETTNLPSSDSDDDDLQVTELSDSSGSPLRRFIDNIMSGWAKYADDADFYDSDFWRFVTYPFYKMHNLSKLLTSLRRLRQNAYRELLKRPNLDKTLNAVLHESLEHFVIETWVSGQRQHTHGFASEIDGQANLLSAQIQEKVKHGEIRLDLQTPRILQAIHQLCCRRTADTDRQNPIFGLLFIKNFIRQWRKRSRSTASTTLILRILASVPVVPDVQSVALTVMLPLKRWDVISYADLRAVWEQVRRRLLTAAVKQEQWSLVAQWANYTIYDDQCLEALEEAYTHKQWRVYLLLADHGPVEIELMRVHYRLARYAPWDVVLEMFERGADLTECQEGIRPGKNLRLLDQEKDDNERRPRYVKLLLLQEEWEARMEELQSLEAVLEKQEWCVALHEINRRHRRHEIVLALKAALINRVWHVAIYLIRQGIGARLCDGLFSLMLTHQRWDVCRVLLEEGVDPQLALDALPQLMEQNQWTLVARLMEYDVGDALRRQVMQQALDRREGSVVWQCIINMEHDHLSVEERQELFHEAFNRENWQAVKPLVEVKDDTGLQHRDDALLEAIEQHQWDVVDHCLLFRANINMLDEDNHTPMHRMARKKDWEAVEELTKRGGDPNLIDKDGLSVFHRVTRAGQWELVKLLTKYLGDIHLHACNDREARTPLQMLIDARQVEVIQHTFMWSPDLWRGENGSGETTLHVACLTGFSSILYYLVARRANPLALTLRGHSALSYAVMCRDKPQQTVAECIKFGFSTHQPSLTESVMDSDSDDTSDDDFDEDFYYCDYPVSRKRENYVKKLLSSPLLLAVMRGLPLVTQMLYESGACSHRELFTLRKLLFDPDEIALVSVFYETMTDIHDHPRKFPPLRHDSAERVKTVAKKRRNRCARYVMEVSSSPRSLQSMCRHVVSHSLKLHKNRVKDVNRLPLPPSMKHYVMFSDLTGPDCGREDNTYKQRRGQFVSRWLAKHLSGDVDEEGDDVETDLQALMDTGRLRKGSGRYFDDEYCDCEDDDDGDDDDESEIETSEDIDEYDSYISDYDDLLLVYYGF